MQQVSNSKSSRLGLPHIKHVSASMWKRVREGITIGYVLALFSIYLIYTGAAGYEDLDATKLSAFYWIHGLYFGSLLLTSFMQKNFHVLPSTIPKIDTVDTILIVYTLWVWASAFSSPYWPDTIRGLNNCEGAFVLTVYALVLLTLKHYGSAYDTLVGVVGVNVALFCSICLPQFNGYDLLGLYKGGTTYADYCLPWRPGQFCGTIGNSNLVALFLTLCIPMFTFAIIRYRHPIRFLLVVPLVLALWVLHEMWVLLGFVGVACGVLFAIPIAGVKKDRWKWAVGVAVLCIAFLVVIYFTGTVGGVFHEIHLILHGRLSDDMGSGRFYIWRGLLKEIPDALIYGYGPDSVLESGLEPFITVPEGSSITYVSYFTDAHNLYLNTLYCLGVPGLASFLALLAHAGFYWVKLAPKNNYIAIVGAGLFAYCIAAFFCISHYSVSIFFWCLLGLFESEVHRAKKHKS